MYVIDNQIHNQVKIQELINILINVHNSNNYPTLVRKQPRFYKIINEGETLIHGHPQLSHDS